MFCFFCPKLFMVLYIYITFIILSFEPVLRCSCRHVLYLQSGRSIGMHFVQCRSEMVFVIVCTSYTRHSRYVLHMKCDRNNADTAVTLRDYCEHFRPTYLFYFPVNCYFFIVNLRFCSMPKCYLVRISLLMFNLRFLPLDYSVRASCYGSTPF